ncbi:mfs transporter [Diplodia corticola]|uniref:Mfs transporter n=1 Tax=Diplodia corticola TaxID=236234 RepID=A0A1J9RSX7_9PEZI|nr:mfs transporter [Diplodia corticola]OJD30637.1 mfs transporter [Diplodia corticola]
MASLLQQAIHLPATSSGGSSEAQDYLIFFIPGNPGPAAYYREFLSSLHRALRAGSTTKIATYEILTVSLAGAGAGADDPPSVSSMAGEIDHMEAVLLDRVSKLAPGREKKAPVKLILIGHCAGAYIALELLKRWRQDASHEEGHVFAVAGSVCLFPSVPVKTFGGTVSQAVLTMLSNSALFVHHSVRLLLFLVPPTVIETLLRSTTGLSQDAAKVTNEMMGSPRGIYQALTLWRNQMEDQKSGRWDDIISDSGCATTSPTYMLFSQNSGEPEVGRSKGRLDLVAGINKAQLPDRFFTTQKDSKTVAGFVKEYVEEIVKQDKKA